MPTALRDAEWVGPAVLFFAAAAIWAILRGSQPRWQAAPARPSGIASITGIVLGVWAGSTVHPIPGVALLISGCSLSLWAVLQLLGVTWRNHVRPSLAPILILATVLICGWYWPRVTGILALLVGLWSFAVIRASLTEAGVQLKQLLIRASILSHVEPATHLVHVWFARALRNSDITLLLGIAHKARGLVQVLPRLRSIGMATGSLQLLTDLTDDALEKKLRTDEASRRATSWVRVLARRFFRNAIRKTGIAAAAQLLSAVLLAVPPAREQGWSDQVEQPATTPDTEENLRTVLTALPASADETALLRIREQVKADGSRAGARWFGLVAARAERWRQAVPADRRDCRLELLGEVIWGLYEDYIGPRPAQYDLYDQLRLQVPEFLEGLAVESSDIDHFDERLLLLLRGQPNSFHDLTFSVGRRHTGAELRVETRDGRTWVFERLEAGEWDDILVVFKPVKK